MADRDPRYGNLPRLLRTAFADDRLFACGLVVEKNEDGQEILSEEQGLRPNYINWIRTGFPRTQSATDPKTLLYLLLRHAALLEQARAGLQILQERNLVGKDALYERELVKIASNDPTIFEHLDRRVAGLTGRQTLAEYLLRPRSRPATPQERIVDDYREALRTLEPLPTAELERLFAETFDVCAYRLDAWTTSLATKRLQTMREQHSLGAYVGAYGWVENLKPFPRDERSDVAIEGEPGVSAFTHNGGYVYAPSMTHAAAAAVLRNAYMTRAGEQKRPYAINLSSARVRTALWLLDTVREGQTLGAGLGYLFERELHERNLDRLIDNFRGLYPLVANRMSDSGQAAESIAARNVVDGYELVTAWKQWQDTRGGTWSYFDATPPELDPVVRVADDALDALADLLTAEAVFQLVGGSIEGAGATLDAMAKGAHPPEPEIAGRARGGTSLTHRVALALGGGEELDEPWASLPRTPRAQLEPLLNAWVGRMLGDPSDVVCSVGVGEGDIRRVTLRDLQLQPLDVLALARTDAQADPLDSELDRRVAFAATALGGPGATAPLIRYEMPDGGPLERPLLERTFTELLEVARSINELLHRARALQPSDLLLPEESSDVERAGADLLRPELQARTDAALGHLTATIQELDDALAALAVAAGDAPDYGPLRAALRAASLLGVAAAFPPWHDRGLAALGESVRKDLRARGARAVAESDPIRRAQRVLGRDVAFLPRFRPARRGELGQALAHPPSLGADADTTITAWFAKAARVRPPLGAWRMLSLYAGAMGRTPALPTVLQLPYADDARWVGLSFENPGDPRPPAGRVSLVLLDGRSPGVDDLWAGLLVDEWVELIPSATEDAGVVFHYDRPGTEAPQAVLIAVPPDAAEPWSLDLLLRIAGQTFETVKTRGFDGEWKTDTGSGHALYDNPWLPLILLAESEPDATIATTFGECLERKAGE